FFQAEDGIRDLIVTGVQKCALPILGWRMLGTDPDGIAFNLYRSSGDGPPVRLNEGPITASTNFVDGRADLTRPNAYTVRPVLDEIGRASCRESGERRAGGGSVTEKE